LTRDGSTELLISDYDENPSDPTVGSAFCSGHWVTRLYRFKQCRAEELRSSFGGLTFPFVHNWSYGVKECPLYGQPLQKVEAPRMFEHGTSKSGEVRTTLRASTDHAYHIEPVGGCKTVSGGLIVYDRPKIRQIAFPTLWDPTPGNLLQAIQIDHVPVRLSGLDYWMGHGDCTANLIWANPQ
jgi:hypothetical protein